MELKNEDGLTEKEFLAQYRPGNYERPSVTVDMLIFAVDPEAEDEDPELLLIRRRNHPCIGQWAMPGGFVNMDESLEEAAARELEEETGITGRVLRHLATIDYWFAGHEHRVHKVVHHFLLEAVSGTLTTENDPDHEAEDVEWVALDDVSHRLAYPNERRIVRSALDLLYRDNRG